MDMPFLWSLPPDAAAAGVARRVLRQRCSSLPNPLLEDALLLVTELVANAIRHGQGPVTLALIPRQDRLRVEVTDASAARPRPRTSGVEAESGRGLQIVDVLASRWGAVPRQPTGKSVWFELDLRTQPAEPVDH